MKIRRDLTDTKKFAEKLTTRQMEFIECIEQTKVEKLRIKALKLSSENRATVYISVSVVILLIIGFILLNLNSLYTKVETIEALKLGYEKNTRPGTTYMFWSKSNEKDSNERFKDWGTEDSERNSLYDRPTRRDSLGKQSEESTEVLIGTSSISSRKRDN